MLTVIIYPEATIVRRMIGAILAAFIGTLVFFLFLRRVSLKSSLIVPIVGIMLGAVVGAVSTFIAVSTDMLQSLGIWFAGGFTSILRGQYEVLWIVAIVVVAVFITADRFTVAGLGKEISTSVGLKYNQIILIGTVLVAIATGVVTVVVGNLPFLGLIVPNIVSMMRGDDLRSNLPWVCLLGIAIVTVCDLIGRLIIAPFEIPVSLILGIVGAAVFIVLPRRGGGADMRGMDTDDRGAEPRTSATTPAAASARTTGRHSGALTTVAARRRYWTIMGVLAAAALGIAFGLLAWDNPPPITDEGFWLIAGLRGRGLVVLIIVALCQAFATVAFQTVTNNRIITPSIMGFESLYVAIQTATMYFFGVTALVEPRGGFALHDAAGRDDRAIARPLRLVALGEVRERRGHASRRHRHRRRTRGGGDVHARTLTPSEFDVLSARLFGSIANSDATYLPVAIPSASSHVRPSTCPRRGSTCSRSART